MACGTSDDFKPDLSSDEQKYKHWKTVKEEIRRHNENKAWKISIIGITSEPRKQATVPPVPLPTDYLAMIRVITFFEKVQRVTKQQYPTVLEALKNVNLTGHLESLVEHMVRLSKFELDDIASMVNISLDLQQHYLEFTPLLFNEWRDHWKEVILLEEEETNRKVKLSFFACLVSCQIFSLEKGKLLLTQILLGLMERTDPNTINVVLSFCKHDGYEFAGLISKKLWDRAGSIGKAISRSKWLPLNEQEFYKDLILTYYQKIEGFLEPKIKEEFEDILKPITGPVPDPAEAPGSGPGIVSNRDMSDEDPHVEEKS